MGAAGGRPEGTPDDAATSEPPQRAASGPTGEELARAWFAHSPLIGALGMQLVAIAAEEATVVLPYRADLATAGDIVHGGAIMSLLDTAAALAAWSAHDPSRGVRWGTVSVSVSFLEPARGRNLTASAHVTRRGRNICFCRVDVEDSERSPVAEALVSYRLG